MILNYNCSKFPLFIEFSQPKNCEVIIMIHDSWPKNHVDIVNFSNDINKAFANVNNDYNRQTKQINPLCNGLFKLARAIIQ